MSLNTFIAKIRQQEKVSFQETIAVITAAYRYQPTEFFNGLGADRLCNAAGSNEGSCKIFAFARLHDLSPEQTLSLFGDYYWQDVLQHPEGLDHQNIRTFMRYGWAGIAFSGEALSAA